MFLTPKNASEVIPRLWQGAKPAFGQYSFDLIVLAADEYQPSADKFPGADVLHVPLPDDWRGLTSTARAALYTAAAKAAEAVASYHRNGKAVLVTCGAGLNRSGLINGLALRNLGYSGAEAITLIRKARGIHALRGKAFSGFITRYQPGATLPEIPSEEPRWMLLGGVAIGVAVAVFAQR